jgi:hypothetical protein
LVFPSTADFVPTIRVAATASAFSTSFLTGRRDFFAAGLRAAAACFRAAANFLEPLLRRLEFAAFRAAAKAAACVSSAFLRAFLDALRVRLKSRRACLSRRFASRAWRLASLACSAAALAFAASARASWDAVNAGLVEMGAFINSHSNNEPTLSPQKHQAQENYRLILITS